MPLLHRYAAPLICSMRRAMPYTCRGHRVEVSAPLRPRSLARTFRFSHGAPIVFLIKDAT